MVLDHLRCRETRGGVRCGNWRDHQGPHDWDRPRFTQADLDAAVAKATQDLEWQLAEVLKQRDADIAFAVAEARKDERRQMVTLEITKSIARAVEAEREACAVVCQTYDTEESWSCAHLIRERKAKT